MNQYDILSMYYGSGRPQTLMEILSQGENRDDCQEKQRQRQTSYRRKRESESKSQTTTVASNSNSSISPPRQLVSTTLSSDGTARVVSERDVCGKFYVRIEYAREQMVFLAHSPFSVVPPDAMTDVVANHPELIPSLPARHYGNL